MADSDLAAERRLDLVRRLVTDLAARVDVALSLELWDGSVLSLGKDAPAEPRLRIAGEGVVASLLRRPTLTRLARHYAAGDITIVGGDAMEVADRLRARRTKFRFGGLDKRLLLRALLAFWFVPQTRPRLAPDQESGGKAAARDLIQFHYDIGNDFYALFLDPLMQYSCAYFTDWSNSLEQAQRDKLDHICKKLRLTPGDRLLDVGCGWGGLICHAGEHYGVEALGVTLSQAQHDMAQERIAARDLGYRVRVELRDYRELEGSFDKIASIGMYEHVGIANYPVYFGKLRDLLRPRGLLLNHGITRRAKRDARSFRRLRPEKRLILRYVFPGSELDHVGHSVAAMEAAGFEIHDVEGLREHYARTTRLWCQRLAARAVEAEALAGPERVRMWQAYLAGVCVNFESGALGLHQILGSKRARGPSGLPPTRRDLYAETP